MDSFLLATKVRIPPQPHRAVRRARLIDALESGIPHYKLVQISAPAGYGKTTLLVQWAHASCFRLEPRRAGGRGSAAYTVSLQNSGNTPAHYELIGEDDEQKVVYQFATNPVDLEPGREARVPLTVRTRRRWIGREQRQPFQVHAYPVGSTISLSAPGEFLNKALLPSPPPRVPFILVGLSLLGLLSAGVLLVQHPNLIPFVGVIAGSLIFLAGTLLAIRVLMKRAQSRAAQRRELEEARRPEQERAYYEKALAAYEQALSQNKTDATAYRGRGNALVGLERYDEALPAFEQASVLKPLPTVYVSMGNVLATLGRCEEAVAAYEQALALDASYASAYTGMSEALLQLGRMQEAGHMHERAMQLGYEE